jgi:MFS family permease
MGFYAFTLAGSNYFTPVLCGFIAEGQGWQWVFYYPTIFLGILLLFLFFFMEETNYVRKTSGVVAVANTPLPEQSLQDDREKSPTITKATDSEEVGEVYGHPKTFIQKLSLWHPTPGKAMLQRAIDSLKFLSWPVIFYAGFSYGSYVIWFNVLNATASVILSAPPYNFSASMVGLSYLSCTIGVVVGALLSGNLSDWLTLKLSRRNGGIMEAEFRLWPFACCLVLVPCSLIIWGVGAAQGIHWFGLVFSMGMLACATTFGVTLSVNYLIDSYHDISGDAIVTLILVRNTMSFAMSYG